MLSADIWPLLVILVLGGVVFAYVLRVHNPKLTTVTIGPLFLYLVAGMLGISQLYLMGTMVLSVCAVCCVFSIYALRRIEVTRTASTPVTCGDPVEIRIELQNRDWIPKLLVRVHSPLPEWLETDQETFVLPGLWPGKRVVCRIHARAVKRGCFSLAHLEVTSADPLDIFPRTARREAPTEVVVYPAVEDAIGLDLWGDDFFGAVPARRVSRPTRGLDFHSLRDYHPGDDVRTIDWKATARMSRLIVVEFEPTQVGDLVVLLDNRGEVQSGKGDRSTLERAISAAAGALVGVLEARGTVRLRYLDAGGAAEVASQPGEDGTRFLEAMARVEPRSGNLQELVPLDVRGRVVLIATPDTGTGSLALVQQVMASGGRPVIVLVGGDEGSGPPVSAERAAGRLREAGARVLLLGPAGPVRERGGLALEARG